MAEPSLAPKTPFEVGIGLQDRLGDLGRLQVIAVAVLDGDDLDVGVGLVHAADEALDPIDAGAARLIVGDDGDLTRTVDHLGHLVGSERGGGDVVGRGGGDGDVAVDAGIEGDDGDALLLGLPKERDGRLAVERGEADRGRVLGERGREHVDLPIDHRLVVGPLERHLDAELLGRLIGAALDRLPELVLEALGDQRDQDRVVLRRGG